MYVAKVHAHNGFSMRGIEMVARRGTARKAASAPARTRKAAPAPATRTRKATPAKAPAKAASRKADVTAYAEKAPTDYHKAFAKWILQEVGYDANEASSKRMAFLMGVSIATAARPAFMQSDFLEEWRERTGTTKRGPKVQEEDAPVARRRKAEPEPVEEDEDFEEDESEEFEEDDEEFEDDDSEEDDEDEDFEDDEDSEDDEDFEEDEEVEEEPTPRARSRSTSRTAGTRAKKAAPAKKATLAKKAVAPAKRRTAKDDDFLF